MLENGLFFIDKKYNKGGLNFHLLFQRYQLHVLDNISMISLDVKGRMREVIHSLTGGGHTPLAGPRNFPSEALAHIALFFSVF